MNNEKESLLPPANALQAVVHPDPWPFYRALRRGAALTRDEGLNLWIATSAQAVMQVLEHPQMRVRPLPEPVPKAIAGAPAGEVFARLVRMNEGRAHAQPRVVLQRVLAGLDAAHVRERAVRVAAGVSLQAGSAQQLNQWAFEVPVSVTGDLLGFAAGDLPLLAAWTRDFIACLSPLSSPQQLGAASEAAAELIQRMRVMLAASAAKPGTVISAVKQEADATGWNDADAIIANLVGLLSQTYEATAGLVGNSIVALLTHEGLRDDVGRTPERIAELIEEVARHDPPVHNTRRFAQADIELCGEHLKAGDAVLVVLAAANRDPLANAQPDEFLLQRADRRAFGFGHGRHACPGMALAKNIAACAIEVLLEKPLPPSGKIAWTWRPSANSHIPLFGESQ